MKISVVIPAYNEEKLIGQCLQSLLNQTVPPDEIIVVDNNSTDRMRQIVRRFPVRVIGEAKKGITPARNAGFNAARGDIIARTDADTIVPRDWVEKVKKHFEEESIDALGGPIGYYDFEMGGAILWMHTMYMHAIKKLQNGGEMMYGANMALTKKMWERIRNNVNLDDGLVHEDLDISMHINDAGGRILRDDSLVIWCSSRRLRKQPLSLLGEYPIRFLRTCMTNRQILRNMRFVVPS